MKERRADHIKLYEDNAANTANIASMKESLDEHRKDFKEFIGSYKEDREEQKKISSEIVVEMESSKTDIRWMRRWLYAISGLLIGLLTGLLGVAKAKLISLISLI